MLHFTTYEKGRFHEQKSEQTTFELHENADDKML